MKKKLPIFVALAVAVVSVSCSSVVAPLAATSNPLGTKVGESKASLLFGIIPLKKDQDGGIAAAAKNGGITRISTVDLKTRNWIIGVTRTTIVTGE